jgi:hypothetical protein
MYKLLVVRTAKCCWTMLGTVARVDNQRFVTRVCILLQLAELKLGNSLHNWVPLFLQPINIMRVVPMVEYMLHHPSCSCWVFRPQCLALHARMPKDIHLIVQDPGCIVEALGRFASTRNSSIRHKIPKRRLEISQNGLIYSPVVRLYIDVCMVVGRPRSYHVFAPSTLKIR